MIVRVGRVLWWLGLGIASVLSISAIRSMLTLSELPTSYYKEHAWEEILIYFGFALAIALVGRGMRYILANE